MPIQTKPKVRLRLYQRALIETAGGGAHPYREGKAGGGDTTKGAQRGEGNGLRLG